MRYKKHWQAFRYESEHVGYHFAVLPHISFVEVSRNGRIAYAKFIRDETPEEMERIAILAALDHWLQVS